MIEPLSEHEVLQLVVGLSNQPVGDLLIISLGTAKMHIENIHGKLDVCSRWWPSYMRELTLLTMSSSAQSQSH